MGSSVLRRAAVRIMAPAVAAVAITASLTGAAHAASYPTSTYNITYGNTYTKGTVTWYNRSVSFSGSDKSVSLQACRATWGGTYESNGTQLGGSSGDDGGTCNTSNSYYFTVSANVAGGASYVVIDLTTWNGGGKGTVLASERLYRP